MYNWWTILIVNDRKKSFGRVGLVKWEFIRLEFEFRENFIDFYIYTHEKRLYEIGVPGH